MPPQQISEIASRLSSDPRAEPTAYLLQGSPPGGSKTLAFSAQSPSAAAAERFTVVSLDFEWKGHHIRDQFTWSCVRKDPTEMREFAHHTIEDLFGHHKMAQYHPKDVGDLTNRIAYEISKQVTAAEFFESLAATTASGHGLRGEHVVHIRLNYKDSWVRFKDEFDWDLANPANSYTFDFLILFAGFYL